MRMTMSAFDIPIHNKNISTRDFAVRPEQELQPVCRKERPPPQLHVAAVLIVACLTLWHALQQTLTTGLGVASTIHFYVACLAPTLLYEHIVTPCKSKHVWILLVVHIANMLFSYPYDREFVSFRLHVLVLALCVFLLCKHRNAQMKWQVAIGMCACLYSTCSVLMFAQESTSSSSHYHVSFLVLFTALVVLLYAH
jgi:hypothetical protein